MKLFFLILICALATARVTTHKSTLSVPFTEGREFCNTKRGLERYLSTIVYCMGEKAVQCLATMAVEVPGEHRRCVDYNTHCASVSAEKRNKPAFCGSGDNAKKLVKCDFETNQITLRTCTKSCITTEGSSEDHCEDACYETWTNRETEHPKISNGRYHACDTTSLLECEEKYTRGTASCDFGCYRYSTNVDSTCKPQCQYLMESNERTEESYRTQLARLEERERAYGGYRDDIKLLKFRIDELPNDLTYCESEGTSSYAVTCSYSRLTTGLAVPSGNREYCSGRCVNDVPSLRRFNSLSERQYARPRARCVS